jgi:hypothetical protein
MQQKLPQLNPGHDDNSNKGNMSVREGSPKS